eukprot:1495294-Rhodomonas_salina.3
MTKEDAADVFQRSQEVSGVGCVEGLDINNNKKGDITTTVMFRNKTPPVWYKTEQTRGGLLRNITVVGGTAVVGRAEN